MKKKIFLTTQEIGERKIPELVDRYKVHRSTMFRALKTGWFYENAQEIQESLSPSWVEKNLELIKKEVNYAVRYKSSQKGIFTHRLFEEFKKDIYQDGIFYVMQRAGEIESGKAKLGNIAKTGVDHAIMKYFFYRDGKNTVEILDFWDQKSLKMKDISYDEEINLDDFFINIQELISSISEEYWDEVWNWALSRKTKCSENVRAILKEVEL